jgi:hypothetical protein
MLGQRLSQVEALLQGSNAREMNAQFFNPILNQHVPQQPLMEYQSVSQPATEQSPEHHNPSPSSKNTPGISEHAAPDIVRRASESGQSLNATIPRPTLYTPPSSATEVSSVICRRLHTFEGADLNREAPRLAIDNEESIVSPENVGVCADTHNAELWLMS